MDLLADVLRQSGLRRRILGDRRLPRGTALEFPCERSIGFHVVTQGEVFIHAGRGERIALASGDVALMARGQSHVVSTEAEYVARRVKGATFTAGERETKARKQGCACLVSGAYQFWNEPIHPLFAELPDWYVLRRELSVELDQLHLAIGLLGRETGQPGLGSESIVNALLDVIFTYLVRRLVAEVGETRATWCHALVEPEIRKVVELMHAEFGRDWTLSELAREAGMSRASFAAKFRATLGETPLHYLRTLRMQRAMALLSDTQETLQAVANAVGYSDAFGFSKVFKKTTGVSPREFRVRDRADRALSFRLQ